MKSVTFDVSNFLLSSIKFKCGLICIVVSVAVSVFAVVSQNKLLSYSQFGIWS